MASLKFVDQHNMVACLEKSEENTEFHQIVDFLSTCSINYALTITCPTGSCFGILQRMTKATGDLKIGKDNKEVTKEVGGKVANLNQLWIALMILRLVDGRDSWEQRMVVKRGRQNIEDSSRPARSVLTLKPLPTIDPKDKGRGVLEEPEPVIKMTKSDFDADQITKR
ncbi:hypothetical protein Tco_1244455 [Tanacetum coccineum]